MSVGPPDAAPPGTTFERAEASLGAFDDAVDVHFERFRGQRGPDLVARALSNLADYGAVWAALAGTKSRHRGARRRRATRSLAIAGFSSLAVNAGIKALVQRQRPIGAERSGAGLPVRDPSSTSFPSGHTLAAFCTAVVLAESPAQVAGYLAFATAVAASRVHLRAHHASDVVGGAVIGTVLGAAGRRVLRRHRLEECPTPRRG